MNIFVFDPSPTKSAMWLDDVRQNKMILETAQLLSTAIRVNNPLTDAQVYKATHKHHPCTKWVCESRSNFSWALEYLKQLGDIRNPNHKSLQLVEVFEEYLQLGAFEKEGYTPFVNCARNAAQGLDFTSVTDTFLAYRLYIKERWVGDKIRLTWNYGNKPSWG